MCFVYVVKVYRTIAHDPNAHKLKYVIEVKKCTFDRMYSWTLETSSPQDFCRQRKLVLILEKLLLSSGLLEKETASSNFEASSKSQLRTYTSHNLFIQK